MQINTPAADITLPEELKQKIDSVRINLAFCDSEVKRLTLMKKQIENEVDSQMKKNAEAEVKRAALQENCDLLDRGIAEASLRKAELDREVATLAAQRSAILEEKRKFTEFVNSIV